MYILIWCNTYIHLPFIESNKLLSVEHFSFDQEKIEKLAKVCRNLNAKIVVSSDWRTFNNKETLIELLGPLKDHIHEDWRTPVSGPRYNEIALWLVKHSEQEVVTKGDTIISIPMNFVILDDVASHFEDASYYLRQRLILCNTNLGLTDSKIELLYKKFNEQNT